MLRRDNLNLVAIEKKPLVEFVVLLDLDHNMIGVIFEFTLRRMNRFGEDIFELF